MIREVIIAHVRFMSNTNFPGPKGGLSSCENPTPWTSSSQLSSKGVYEQGKTADLCLPGSSKQYPIRRWDISRFTRE
jgi:hypothetical protein